MKKRIWIGFLLILIFSACRKDPNDPLVNQNGSKYVPTVIDPTTIFPVSKFGLPNLPADNPFTEEGIYLGRMLFYDPILSYDSSVSCGSCHRQENAFADPVSFSSGIYGLKTGRNSSSLMNLAYSKKFFWDARQTTLREQIGRAHV